ncbi:hypothetical protein SACIG1242_2501 [Staphylococcus aureus subsp. aureus CIG1242]|nr:hypothetical protein SACIG1242_2501 [Staphylococcus aureus subsp. aureus CIG1242]
MNVKVATRLGHVKGLFYLSLSRSDERQQYQVVLVMIKDFKS